MRHSGVLAVLVLALGYASLVQGGGWNQNAHFALVQALERGTPVIDRYRTQTGDVAWYRGHYYAAKAPGLALFTVGPYFVLDHLGIAPRLGHVPGASTWFEGSLWALGLIGCVLPAAVLLLLVRRIGDELQPRLGTAAAVTLGLGTLLLPFATVFFDHALSTAFGFGAFAVLWSGRDRPGRVAAAGLLAGLAVTCEYPLLLVAIGLGLYVLATSTLRRGVGLGIAYAAGFLIGVLPAALYNWWAFGSPTHLSYADALAPGISGHDRLTANARGLFGVGSPSFDVAVRLLFSHIGLLTFSPIVAVGAAGTFLLYRRGRRAEAVLIAALALAFLVYNSGYETPFGGNSPGPRFLIPILPFLAVPLALAYRTWPATTLVLAVSSALVMLAVTAARPLYAFDGHWFDRITNGTFNGHGAWQPVPLALLALAAVVLAARSRPLGRPTLREAGAAAAALLGWLLLAFAGPRLLAEGPAYTAALALAATAVIVGLHRALPAAAGGPQAGPDTSGPALGEDWRDTLTELRRIASDPHVVLAVGAAAVVLAEYGYRTHGHPYDRHTNPIWLLLEAAFAFGALVYAWRAQDRIRLVPLLGLALAFHLAWLGLHVHLGVPGDRDTGVYHSEGMSLLHGHYPRSEYPPGAVVLFTLEAWLHGSHISTANQFVMVPFQLAIVVAIWSLRTRFSTWLAALVAFWPMNMYYWEFRFDLVPAAFLAAGLALAFRHRWGWSGLMLGVGTAVKWSPALSFAALGLWCLLAGRRRSAGRLSLFFAAGVLAFYVPFLVWSPGPLGHAYSDQSGRPFTGASIWYLPFHLLGQTQPIAKSYAYAGAPHWANTTAIVIQVLVVAAAVSTPALAGASPSSAVALAAIAPVVFFLTNRIFSPQFLVPLLAAWAFAAALVVESRREQLYLGVSAMLAALANIFVGQFVLWDRGSTWLTCSVLMFLLSLLLTLGILRRGLTSRDPRALLVTAASPSS